MKWFFVKCVASFGYLPPGRLTNAQLEKEYGVSSEEIQKKTGIQSRSIADQQFAASDLAYEAVNFYFKSTHNDAESVTLDALIVATTSGDVPSPATAHSLHNKLKLQSTIHCFDIASSCTSFLSALRAGIGILESRVIVVATECKQKMLDVADLKTRSLFGDGAAGIVLEPSNGTEAFAFVHFSSQSQYFNKIQTAVGGSREPVTLSNLHRSRLSLSKSTYPIIINEFVISILASWKQRSDVLETLGLCAEDVDGDVYLHQANVNILLAVIERLPKEISMRIRIGMEDIGNLVCASLPMFRLRSLLSQSQKPHLLYIPPASPQKSRIDIWCAAGGGMQTIAILHAQNLGGLP